MGRCIMANGYEATGTGIEGLLPGTSSGKDIPSEAEVMQEYYANISRPGSGATGGDYLSTVGGFIPEKDKVIDEITSYGNINYGPDYERTVYITPDESNFSYPIMNYNHSVADLWNDPNANIQDKIWGTQQMFDPSGNVQAKADQYVLGPIDEYIADPAQKYIGPIKERYWDPIQKRYIDPAIENISERVNEAYDNAEYAVQKEIYETYKDEDWFERKPPTPPIQEIDVTAQKRPVMVDGYDVNDPTNLPEGTYYDEVNDMIIDSSTGKQYDGGPKGSPEGSLKGDPEGEGGGIKGMLSKAYDKLGIQGILGILSLLGLGKAAGASGDGDAMGGAGGGIGSFASSQFDPSGFGATADYANMPGGGVGQPTFLPNTNAPIYYPFASEVTKQYNAQSPEPFSFTRGPAPEAMIQNLDYQQVPGVQYVADGAFMRRNGLTEGPGTETSDDIPAMLSDGEFVTNAEANRGIGAMALLNQGMPQEVAMNPEQQRLAGARQMYLQQAMGQQLAKQMRDG